MKRMIDNKEFEKIKNDVSELKEEIENIEGIPTITIDVTQATSQSTFDLTDEQIETLDKNSVVYVNLPNGMALTLLKEKLSLQSNDFINFISLSYDINQDEQVEHYIYSVNVNKVNNVCYFEGNKLEGGKQLYQHNICLAQTSQVTEYNLYCTIISDRDTAYDFASLTSYLQEQVPQNYGIVLSGKAYYQNDNVVTKFATRIYYSTNQNAIRIEYINSQWNIEYKQLDGTIYDNVVAL